ncbi:MAG: haloacid dehalogenase type II [Pseudomonadota bacterium]
MPQPVSRVAADDIRSSVRVLTFDLYGTVVDMQGGLVEKATPYLKGKNWDGSPNRFVTWWRRTHFENSMIDALLHRTHTPYREIGRRAVKMTLERAGIDHTASEVDDLVAHIPKLKPFPEVPAALERLKGRYKLAILSNGDPDLLEEAKAHVGFPFEHWISISTSNYFKPHAQSYIRAAEILGEPTWRVMHVANHAFDCTGARGQGMRAAYINRRDRPYEDLPAHLLPDIVTGTIGELADTIT